ncbi:uncharacterized protein LOC112055609 isoform X2 [Bicyclus anynana]|uniref:Uncharacterized protein LOC112055609 isoform X2 n=1 Tax=Bicyclus anynana TaxID=110368 RepID=A0ABM3LEK9_BICAN|nr:uncharacterized protein LOC112055609 isoform X2 [Bicyclus anynana]
MADKDDYLTSYREFFENFAATVDPEDQLPVNIAGYTITEAELPGEVLYWTTQYLTEKECPLTLMTHLQRIILDEVRIAAKKHPNEFGYNSDESEYIALRLMQAVTARVNDVCLRYLDNARLDSLPPPPPQSFKEFKTFSSATKNSRRAMEDRHVEIGNLEALFGIETTEPTSFYAVYDGHAGSAAATYCAAHLHQYLVESPHFTRDLRLATHDAYLRTDAEFIRKSNQKRASGGSTAVSVAVRGRRLVAAWAGDSLALLAKRMRLMQLVNPHKPDRPDEKERIESSGGTVMFWGTWRVNGQLAVSRAIGDAQYKPYVTARPEMVVVELDGDEDFVVVACDGLWDVLSEDAVALSVYKQLMSDPDDLKAVPKNLVRQAKRDGSEDNISVIVVFLKDPRDIVADNCPPMDLGLDNPVVNVPPFALENEACKVVAAETGGGDCAEGGDNGVSDSDSDDLGPETAVDAELDVDDDAELRDEPAPPTPPAHAVEASHVDGNLVDNVAESGEESEDEWNYFKGEGEREQVPADDADEPPRSDTPGQDNSAWESSSVDMNSSPLNPDAPVFVPGSVAGSDVLLAQSPRKPMPMDDIELPDGNQFQSEAVVRPAELQDLDNSDHLNGHHNISMEGVIQHLNGNEKNEMDSLGFGFNVGIEQEKIKDNGILQEFERIQKDTTDFCNIQVFQANTETNPFNTEGDDELFERLKNKERDPMSMSFYQEKDDDTCERFGKLGPSVDLNAVQLLPDSDDEDMQPNGIYQNEDKENVCPSEKSNFFNLEDGQEPNNDIMRFDDVSAENVANNITNLDNFMDFNVNNTNNVQNYSNAEFECNVQQDVVQTDTPESHKLLFEQIPEIPDGKSSELGFTNEDLLDPSESDKDARAITPQDETSQDIEMESKLEESPTEEVQAEISGEIKDDLVQSDQLEVSETSGQIEPLDNIENDITESETSPELEEKPIEQYSNSSDVAQGNVIVDVHQNPESEFNNFDDFEAGEKQDVADESVKESSEFDVDTEIRLETEQDTDNLEVPASQMLSASPIHSPALSEPLLLSDSPVCTSPSPKEPELRESPLPQDTCLPESSPLPQEELSALRESPYPQESLLPSESPLPNFAQEATETNNQPSSESPMPIVTLEVEEPVHRHIDSPVCEPLRDSPSPVEPLAKSPLPVETVRDSPLPVDAVRESPLPDEPVRDSPLPVELPSIEIEQERPESISPAPVENTPDVSATIAETCNIEVTEQTTVAEPILQVEAIPPVEEIAAVESSAPLVESDFEIIPSQEPEMKQIAEISAPTPDIVPEERPRNELVTDIDIGIPESRAQEICVPVTSEIQLEDAVRPGATPPPTPAVSDAPIAAAIAATAAAAVAATAVAATAAKPSSPKKSPTSPTAKPDPKATPKSTAARTPASTKRAAPATPAARTPTTPAARAPAARPSSVKASPAAPRSATKPAASPLKSAAAAKPSPAAAKPAAALTAKPAPRPAAAPISRTTAAPRSAPAPRPAPKAPAPKPATAAPKAAPAAPKATTATSKPAPRPALSARPPVRSTASAPAAKPKEVKPKAPAAPAPLTNGDVKASAKAPPTTKAPSARPAPRPAPRPAAPATAAAPARAAAPKPAARAALDKQSKDLANKRITAKAAPPRTATTKAPVGIKGTRVTKKLDNKKESEKPLTNGTSDDKAPPSPPADALLPDVIA